MALVGVLLLSGCMGDSKGKEPSGSAVASSNDEAPNKLSRKESGNNGSQGAQDVDPNVTLEKEIKWSGFFPRRVAECVATSYFKGCVTFFGEELDNLHFPGINGTIRKVKLDLTWTPKSELTRELTLGVGGLTECECPPLGNYSYSSSARLAKGPSTVSLTAENLPLAPEEKLGIFVLSTNRAEAIGSLFVEYDQEFQVTGTVVYNPG